MGSEAIVKASVYSEEAEQSNVQPYNEDDRQNFYSQAGALVPPFEPDMLCAMFNQSSALRPNVDAMATNIDGFGFRLEPAIDLAAPDADERIKDSLLIEALFDSRLPDLDVEAVAARRRELEGIARIERLRTQLFFDNCCPGMSFVELRMRTRVDLESTGNAYWEVLRNKAGEIAQFNYVASVSMRLMRIDNSIIEIESPQRISASEIRRVVMKRRFRRFIQILHGYPASFFKEFGDPRAVSARTGHIYRDEATLHKEEGDTAPIASEIIHFKIHNPTSVYGIPRWIGATPAVLGTRNSEEVNLAYFRNKAVPPLAVLVSGGTLAAGAADRITNYIKDQIKGKENFHNVLVLEAESAATGTVTGVQGARVRIEIKSLMDSMQQDALFQTYEQNNAEKVGNQFRIPRILRGSMTDFNRSTADAAIRYAEQQVFQPERVRLDHALDAVLIDRGVRFLRFFSNSPVEKDPPALIDMAAKLVQYAIITPNEAREIASDAFNKRFDPIEADWGRIPVAAAATGFSPEATPDEKAAAATTDHGAEPGKDAPAAGEHKALRPEAKLNAADAARVMTVNEARRSLRLGPLKDANGNDHPHGNMAMAEYMAMHTQKSVPAPAPELPSPTDDAGSVETEARRLVMLRDKLASLEGKVAQAALDADRKREAETVVLVPREEFDEWFDRSTTPPTP